MGETRSFPSGKGLTICRLCRRGRLRTRGGHGEAGTENKRGAQRGGDGSPSGSCVNAGVPVAGDANGARDGVSETLGALGAAARGGAHCSGATCRS